MASVRTLRPALMMVAIAAALACTLVAMLALSERRAEAAFPGENGRIAFYTDVRVPGTTESQDQILAIKPDETGTKRLTSLTLSGYNVTPSYSPDGTKIAWVTSDGIWTMNADGTNKRRFTAGSDPAFSADGRRIGFVRNDGIYIKSLRGGAAFSPAGNRIAFEYLRNIWTIRPDGMGLKQVTDTPQTTDSSPNWGPKPPGAG